MSLGVYIRTMHPLIKTYRHMMIYEIRVRTSNRHGGRCDYPSCKKYIVDDVYWYIHDNDRDIDNDNLTLCTPHKRQYVILFGTPEQKKRWGIRPL